MSIYYKYHPYYCEENIWHLAQELVSILKNTKVIFISNTIQRVELYYQQATDTSYQGIVWDYHVVLLGMQQNKWMIYDLDTFLPCPAPAIEYLSLTFPYSTREYQERGTEPLFRLINANEYLKNFSSDRTHMRDEEGNWVHPPPPWPPLFRNTSNFSHYIDFTATKMSEIFSLKELKATIQDES